MKKWRGILILILATIFILGGIYHHEAFARVRSNSRNTNRANDFDFISIKSHYHLRVDQKGITHLDVEEELAAAFPSYDQNHGIERAVPTIFDKRPVFNDDLKAWRNGEEEPINDVSSQNGYKIFRLGRGDQFVHGLQKYKLKYSFSNVILTSQDIQSLYWNIHGHHWNQRFRSTYTRITLDDSVKKMTNGQFSCYYGPVGSTERCPNVVKNDNGEFVVSTLEMPAGSGITIAIGFKQDSFKQPPLSNTEIFIIGLTAIFGVLSIVGLGLFIYVNIKFKRLKEENKFNRPVVAQYLPPKGVSLMNVLNYMQVPPKNIITSLILHFAVNGNVKIIEEDKNKFFGKKKVYKLQLIDANKDLHSDYRSPIHTIFSKGDVFDLSGKGQSDEFKYKVYQSLTTKKTKQGTFVKRKGSTLSMISGFAIVSMIAIMFALGATGTLDLIAASENVLFFVFAGLIIFFSIMIIIIESLSILTPKGNEVKNYLEGLKMYIALAEKDRLKFNQSLENSERFKEDFGGSWIKVYEKLLPWAAIFGLEKSWSKVIEIEMANSGYTPDWYIGSTAFNAAFFASSISSVSNSINSYSSNSVSGGSGVGGGFSGGGGGGGGGGGW